jgi:limonene-1,2-epoxide hydrolase
MTQPLIQHLCQILYNSHFGTAIRESDNASSVIESVHVLSITLLACTIAIFDLRMLGLVLREIRVSRIARAVRSHFR